MAVLKQTKASTKLVGTLGAALAALCIMGAIAAFGIREMQGLGQTLYRESSANSEVRTIVEVDLARAIAEVHSAPAELDLGKLKDKRKNVQSILSEIKKSLSDQAAQDQAENIKAGSQKILKNIEAFDATSKKAFDLADSFAGPEAGKLIDSTLVPIEKSLDAAIKEFVGASAKDAEERIGVMTATTEKTTSLVAGFAVLIVLVVAVLAYFTVLRGIVRPLNAISGAMTKMAGGDTDVEIKYAQRRDEIGQMAAAVRVFKDGMIEAQRLREQKQAHEKQMAAERRSAMLALADSFEKNVGGIIGTVTTSAEALRSTAESMAATAEETSRQSSVVAEASKDASQNVNTVSAASEELSSSIKEISQQVNQSTRIVGESARQVGETNARFQDLKEAAQKIDAVVRLIHDIASQTNLLALNATIEAARAGEAGKGFAVVASEVKALATQTAKATEDISKQIQGIQEQTELSVRSIVTITDTINQVNKIASSIAAAVEEQGAATQEIARSVAQAAEGTSNVSSNIAGVNEASRQTGVAANQVLNAARDLSASGATLRTQVEKFLSDVRAA